MLFANKIKDLFSIPKLYALTQATCVQKIKFVGVVVFEKKRFEAKVDGNRYV
jgi:hypothetical protein